MNRMILASVQAPQSPSVCWTILSCGAENMSWNSGPTELRESASTDTYKKTTRETSQRAVEVVDPHGSFSHGVGTPSAMANTDAHSPDLAGVAFFINEVTWVLCANCNLPKSKRRQGP